MKNLLQPNEILDFYRHNNQRNLLQSGKNLKMVLLMKQSLQSQWTGLNHCYKILQITVEPWQNLMYSIKKFTTRKKAIKNGSTSIWNYAEHLINESVDKGVLVK